MYKQSKEKSRAKILQPDHVIKLFQGTLPSLHYLFAALTTNEDNVLCLILCIVQFKLLFSPVFVDYARKKI